MKELHRIHRVSYTNKCSELNNEVIITIVEFQEIMTKQSNEFIMTVFLWNEENKKKWTMLSETGECDKQQQQQQINGQSRFN